MRCGTRLARPDAHITGAGAVLIAASSFALAQAIRGGPGTNDPSRIVCRGVSVILLARRAYDIAPYQLVAPQWLLELPPEQTEGHFDITATLPPNSTQEDLRFMLQDLLAGRFDFRSHRERRAIPAFVLPVSRKGFKLKDEPGTAHGAVNTSYTALDSGKLSPTLFEALEHECGLRLEKSKEDSEVLVIDR